MPLVRFPLPKNGEGSRAPTGAGADTPHPMTRLAAGSISENAQRSPASDGGRRASRRSAAAFSLRRRAALSTAPSAAVSQLLAGDRCVPGRSPDAARVRGCEPRARAPHRRRPGIAGRPPPKPRTCSPARSPIRSALKTPHECAPQRAGCEKDKRGFAGGDNFFSRAAGRPLASARQPEKHQHRAVEAQHGFVVGGTRSLPLLTAYFINSNTLSTAI